MFPKICLGAADGARLPSNSAASTGARDLSMGLLTIDPDTRPSALEACKHPWLLDVLGQSPRLEVALRESPRVNTTSKLKAHLDSSKGSKKSPGAITRSPIAKEKSAKTDKLPSPRVKTGCRPTRKLLLPWVSKKALSPLSLVL